MRVGVLKRAETKQNSLIDQPYRRASADAFGCETVLDPARATEKNGLRF